MLSTPTDTTCIRCTVLENELQCYDLAVCINSGDDGTTSSKNSVNFCVVTLEMTGFSCERQIRHGISVGMSNISEYTGSIFATFSPFESALRADDGSVPYFPIYEGTLPWQPNNVAIMKAIWYYVHSFPRLPDVSTVLVCYYLLGGDTAAPSMLYSRLCHVFLVYLLHLF